MNSSLFNGSSLSVLAENDSRRVYVLDTNVLLHDPASIFRFQEHLVLLPLTIVEEIDAKKKDPVIGYNAREISQKLESLLVHDPDQLEGANIPNGKGGRLFFLTGHLAKDFPCDLQLEYRDNLMLAQVMGLKQAYPRRKFTFVTKDRNLRIKMRSMGIRTDDYRHDKISEEFLEGLFSPLQDLPLSEEEINDVFKSQNPREWRIPYRRKWRLRQNEGVVLTDGSGRQFGLGIRKNSDLKFSEYDTIRVLGIAPKVLDSDNYSRNYEQALCMIQSLDDSIQVQIVIGKAGTGKTYIAMAAALQMVLKERRYDSIKLVKPIVTKSRLGEDIGFLPGSVKRKLLPKMRPFVEKLRHFTEDKSGYHGLIDSEVIEMINIADVRGADLANSIVIFDEAQNANPFQMRTLGTRLGENTKLIVLGDPTQIDSIYLDQYSNALINLYLNSLRNPKPFIAQTCLTQMVRSYASQWFEETIQDPVHTNGQRKRKPDSKRNRKSSR
jgi:PhoH-like ATPase